MLLVWTFYLSKYHENIYSFHINIAAQLSTVFNIDINKKCFIWSCDTEDWSNDAENSALNNRNNLHFKIYKDRKQLF